MPRKAGNSAKAHHDNLREELLSYGCSVAQIAVELARRFNMRPRTAWRTALGWPQWKVAQQYNLHTGMRLADNRVSEYEQWPHGGQRPSLRYLANLAATFGHGCTTAHLVDSADLAQFTPADRRLLLNGPPSGSPTTPVTVALPGAAASTDAATPDATTPDATTAGDRVDPSRALSRGNGDTGIVRRSRRLVRCDALGVPVGEEIIVAAEESSQFWRWSATTNVNDDVLEQMTADLAEIARREQLDPPATSFTRLLQARDDVFALIEGHQQPRHTTTLYKLAGQLCGMLAIVTFDLGHPHAADTHARTALHCAEVSGHTQAKAFIRWVQSVVAYWDARYDEAAQLVETALPDATSGTTLLRLTSQQARINAARNRPDEVSRALAHAETAPTERSADEPGVLGFDAGIAAMYASEAHYALGGPDHLETAARWAQTALDEFTAQPRPRPQSLAGAQFDLALAHLGRGDLEAVGEQLAPILSAATAEYRTVPIIGRARSLHTLLGQRTDLTSPTLTILRDSLAEVVTHPAPTPPGLEPGTST